ncbi:hypothetical protein JMJ35_004076 [Cladonia borealis]|uniref:Serine hydrolase domain-containing protein n=1 Tax=Cladonia borealis TaxID=184061 RepID=A0AA39V8M2_9LECA|nr:hypothetical protein JMJ35_004076 [Cladonia borealis]
MQRSFLRIFHNRYSSASTTLRRLLLPAASIASEFVEGGIHFLAAPGIATVFPEDPYFAYYDPTHPFTILQAIDNLAASVSAEGPFDDVRGFSHGAALAAMLLARRSPAEPFRFAVFLCAGVPFCEASLRQGVLRHLDPKGDKEQIRAPTAHIVGSKDDALQASLTMKELCVTKGRGLFDHGAGCAEEAVIRATFVQ